MELFNIIMREVLKLHFWFLRVFFTIFFWLFGIFLRILYKVIRLLLRKEVRAKIARFFRNAYRWARRKFKGAEPEEHIYSYAEISEDFGAPIPDTDPFNHPSQRGIEEMLQPHPPSSAAAPEPK